MKKVIINYQASGGFSPLIYAMVQHLDDIISMYNFVRRGLVSCVTEKNIYVEFLCRAM